MTTFSQGRHYEIDPATGCWNWIMHRAANGYGTTHRDGKTCWSHRRMYEQAHGDLADGMHVHHECGNRACVNPAHLKAVTATEHSQIHAGDHAKKLTAEMAREIRAAHGNRERHGDIADRLGISITTVHQVARGETWSHAGGFQERQDGTCVYCNGPIPAHRSVSTRTCSIRCRTALCRAKQRLAAAA